MIADAFAGLKLQAQSAFLIQSDQTAIPRDIGGKDRGEFALDRWLRHFPSDRSHDNYSPGVRVGSGKIRTCLPFEKGFLLAPGV